MRSNAWRRRSARLGAGLLSLWLLGGCFAYVPARTEPAPGSRVRLLLNQPQEIRAGDLTANDVVEVTGEVISADSAAVLLSAFGMRARSGYEFVGTGETARVPRLNIAGVQQNRISPLRTAAIAALAVAAGAVFVSQVQSSRGGGTPGGGGGGGAN